MNPHPKKNTSTCRPFLERLGASSVTEFVGEFGEIFYDPADPTLDSLRISDGKTPGGVQLAGGLKDSVGNIYELIDADKLAEIRNIINSFLDADVDEFVDLTNRIVNLEDTAVRRSGDVMTGGLKIENDNNYKLELLPEDVERPAGTMKFTKDDETKGEIFWDPSSDHIDFAFPNLSRSASDTILEIGSKSVSIYTTTDIQGDLLIGNVNILGEVNKVKAELAAELLGLSVALKTKYNKEGGEIFGPVEVKPDGLSGLTLFSVDASGPQTSLAPLNGNSLTNKAYVDGKLAGLDTALVFKGTIDATTAYPTSVSTGDVWANTTGGTADAQWTGVTDIAAGDLLARGENQWSVVGSGGTVPDLDGFVEVGDNVSDLVNDAGYITSSEAPVQPGDLFSGSYNDLTDKPDIPANTSDLVNDSGFITAGDIPADAVTSVAGKTGAVTLVKADLTDFSDADYATAAQGALADTSVQPGDNVSTLNNDAEYITKGVYDADKATLLLKAGDTISTGSVVNYQYEDGVRFDATAANFIAEAGMIALGSEDASIVFSPGISITTTDSRDITLEASGNLQLNGTVINCSNTKITNLATPVNGDHAATKDYVDGYALPKNLNTLPPLS